MARRVRGTGSIKKTARGFEARRIVERKPRPVYEYRNFRLKADADKWLAKMRGVGGKGLTFEGWARHWLGGRRMEVQDGTLSVAAYTSYRNMLELHAIPFLGQMYLADVTNKDIDRLLADPERKRNGHWLRRKLKTVVNQVFTRAEANGMVATNPVRLAKPIRTNVADEQVSRAMTPAEEQTLREKARGTLAEAFITLALETGARPSELLAMRYCDLDLRNNLVMISASLGRKRIDGPIERKALKTAKGARTFKVDPAALDPFRRYDGPEEVYLFRTGEGSPHDLRNFAKRFFRPVVEAAGLDVSLYSLRHTNATNMARAGVDRNTAAKRLGHSSTRLLDSVYVTVQTTCLTMRRRSLAH
jgi:integrase